ncbi:amidohydrolase family protein [Roseomonas sp. BN140053]|uniref:amidohydrolase family protein n=1 Tax=Roseomonas sp. BN140053 TaxID=3391898 RepID=UPI0039EA893C
MSSPVIDVHTHMLSDRYLDLLRANGGGKYTFRRLPEGGEVIDMYGAPFFTLMPEMFDFAARIRAMDKARIDVSVVSLTSPSAFFGDEAVSLQAARTMNDDFAAAQTAYPDRIRWLATLPWQFPEAARGELERARSLGAVGVMTLANIAGKSLTDPCFAEVWQAIDDAAMPVFVHPSVPPGASELDMAKHSLAAPVGFIFDTTLAVSRMIYDGFFDRYTRLSIIAPHGGGALPYLAGRLDICHERIPACAARAPERPTNTLRRIYVDSVVYRQSALDMCVEVVGPDNVLYGSDFPHNISDMTGCLARVDNLGGELRHAVRGRNAQRLFRL